MTAEASERGWWRRLRANTKDVSPWDVAWLTREKVGQQSARRRLWERRFGSKDPETES